MAARTPRPPSQVLLTKALEKLQDPKVRAQLVGYGRYGMKAAQDWQRDRLAKAGDPAPAPAPAPAPTARNRSGVGRAVGDRFGQGRLERRVDNLRQAVAELGHDRPQLAESLEPVSRALDDVEVTLRVAGGLPLVKRKKAHLKIDGILGHLETALFEATLGGDATEPGA
jgi:hypothetical protein